MKKYTGKIPFDAKGNLCTYDNPWRVKEWRDNAEFEAEMVLMDYTRGRSSVTFVFEHIGDSTRHEMFLSDFWDVLSANLLRDGRVKGRFTYRKHGANYGIYCIKAKEAAGK